MSRIVNCPVRFLSGGVAGGSCFLIIIILALWADRDPFGAPCFDPNSVVTSKGEVSAEFLPTAFKDESPAT